MLHSLPTFVNRNKTNPGNSLREDNKRNPITRQPETHSTDQGIRIKIYRQFYTSAYQIALNYPLSGILDASNFDTQKHRLRVST
jgi:hypothetical protein